MKHSILLFLFFLSFIRFATAQEGHALIVCDGCTTKVQFESVAKSSHHSTVTVANPDKSEAYTFSVYVEPALGGTLLVEVLTPESVFRAFDMYHSIKQSFQDYDSLVLQGAAPNGCGGSGAGFQNHLIPDFPFREACNSHDICYGNGVAKSTCDSAFLNDMYRQGDAWAELLLVKDPVTSVILKNLFRRQAVVYKFFVEEFGTVFYCQDGLNSTNPECILFEAEQSGASIEELGIVGQHHQNFMGLFGIEVNIICDIYQYRITINDSITISSIIEDCKVASG